MTTVPEPSAELLQRAGAVRLAAVELGQTDDQQRADALQAMADALAERADTIVAANLDDLERSAAEGEEEGRSPPMVAIFSPRSEACLAVRKAN